MDVVVNGGFSIYSGKVVDIMVWVVYGRRGMGRIGDKSHVETGRKTSPFH